MKFFKVLFFVSVLLLPSVAFAWGPLTHVYLGSEILSLGYLIPAGIYSLLKKYRHDFLYGNLMADIIIGKKFLPDDKHPHSWDVALNLFDSASTQQQKAFVYGYMSHLAADTVAHGSFTNNTKNIGHTLNEIRADRLIDRKYWVQAVRIDRNVQQRNDIFLEKSLERALFSFKTNKRIFKGMLFLSVLNKERPAGITHRPAVSASIFPYFSREEILQFHVESIDRMVDILSYGRDSTVINDNPIAVVN